MRNQTILSVLRDAGQYFHTYSGSTFVVLLDHVEHSDAASIAEDLAFLCALNIKIILLVPPMPIGNAVVIESEADLEALVIQSQIAQRKMETLLTQAFHQYRITTSIVSCNAVTARPYGIHNGVDFGYFGKPRSIKTDALHNLLGHAQCMMVPTFGYASTGDTFIMDGLEMAERIASHLQCEKLLVLTEKAPILPREMNANLAKVLMHDDALSDKHKAILRLSIPAIESGVERVHILNAATEGVLIYELLTRDGVGAMITNEPYDEIKPAEIGDIQALKHLMQPWEDNGTLKKRSISELEKDIEHFFLMFRDHSLIGAVAYYPHAESKTAELASLLVHPDYRKAKKANALLHFIEQKALADGLDSLFLLTTQTALWFMENGFQVAGIDHLPPKKLAEYDYTRNSKVLIKPLRAHP